MNDREQKAPRPTLRGRAGGVAWLCALALAGSGCEDVAIVGSSIADASATDASFGTPRDGDACLLLRDGSSCPEACDDEDCEREADENDCEEDCGDET